MPAAARWRCDLRLGAASHPAHGIDAARRVPLRHSVPQCGRIPFLSDIGLSGEMG
jgi:hypothetical protein